MDEDKYLNADQAANYIGVDRSRIYALAKAGKIGRKIAGFLVFTREELAQYKATRSEKGGRPRKSTEDSTV